jgi:hypothetical protein
MNTAVETIQSNRKYNHTLLALYNAQHCRWARTSDTFISDHPRLLYLRGMVEEWCGAAALSRVNWDALQVNRPTFFLFFFATALAFTVFTSPP